MKLANIIDHRFQLALKKLANEPLPLKTLFKLKSIDKVIKEEFLKYEDVRKAALSRHGLKSEDGSLKVDDRNNVQFDDEGIKAFVKDISEVTSLDIEVPKIKQSELGNVSMTLDDLYLLEGLISED